MSKRKNTAQALKYIIPILEKYHFKWCISGGFACVLYGIKRPIIDIDIDVETSKDDPRFKAFIEDVQSYTQLPFQYWGDKNFDHYVMDVVVDKILFSIITTKDTKMFNKASGTYELFYKRGIPQPKIIEFEGIQLPVLPENWTIKLKQAFAYPSKRSLLDIKAMSTLLAQSNSLRG